jgi:hypothetical protein
MEVRRPKSLKQGHLLEVLAGENGTNGAGIDMQDKQLIPDSTEDGPGVQGMVGAE